MCSRLGGAIVIGMNLSTTVEQMFAPARHPGRIGLEVELIPVTTHPRPLPVDPVRVAAGFTAAFTTAASPTFEPGGQLELSPPPATSVSAAVREITRLIRAARASAAADGIRLETAGTNPYHSCTDVPLYAPTDRYRTMQQAFDEISPHGRQMMRLTAALQVNVDMADGTDGYEQWLVANLAGPPLAAVFANSTMVDGMPSTTPGARTRIWRGVDPRRTGYDGRHLDIVDPIGAYTAFAAAAPRLPIPAAADHAYHLGTLFPPVRPRGGYLEVRYLDTQPIDRIGYAVSTIALLTYDRRARRESLDLLLPRLADHDRAWAETAAGFSPQAGDLMAIVDAAITRVSPRLRQPITIPAAGMRG